MNMKKDMTSRNREINSVNLYLQQVLIILVVQIDWIKGTTYTAINTANTMISYGNMDVECIYKATPLSGMCDFIHVSVGVLIKHMECDYKTIDLTTSGMICPTSILP